MHWRSGAEPGPSDASDAAVLAAVRARSAALDRTIRRRDRRETVASLIVLLLFAVPLIGGPWLSRAGALLVMAGCVVTIAQLRRTRRRHPAPAPDQPLVHVLAAEQARLEAQIHLLRSVPWWYVAPIALGAVLVFAGAQGASRTTAVYALAVAALAAGVVWLNRAAAERHLEPRRDDIDRLMRELSD